MGALAFLAGQSFVINDLSGSGLGFFGGNGFGSSIQVGAWNGSTFCTDGNGVNNGFQASNVQYLNAGSGVLGGSGSGVALNAIPNWQATVNIRFTNPTPVKTQNAKLQIYDRYNINNPASGVVTAAAQIIHPDISQNPDGSGSTTWVFPAGTGVVLNLCPSPGCSGLYAGNGNNGLWTDTQHDYYVALSSSPSSIGTKTQYGLYVYVEYL